MVQRVGIIGCGNISDIYIENARRFTGIEVVACASLHGESARQKGVRYGLRAMSVADLIAASDIDIALNLTLPAAHCSVSLAALAAGKHVYSEKPLGITVAEGRDILAAAGQAGVRVGCAPDTVLGPGVQLSRQLIEEGETGEIVGGLAAVFSRGMEDWHPNPGFYYRPGGGPVLDMGPYYIAALAMLLGPIRSVRATGRVGARERTVTAAGAMKGSTIAVEVFTTVNALLSFRSGAEIAFLASWDVPNHGVRPIELYGTKASLRVPDPDFFGGNVEVSTGGPWKSFDTSGMAFGALNDPSDRPAVANYRGIGLADMAATIEAGRPHRCSGDFGLHILAVIEAILVSAVSGQPVDVTITAGQPAPFGAADAAALSDERHRR